MRCVDCGMPDGRHTSDCSVRLSAKRQRQLSDDNKMARDFEAWSGDPDVKLIVEATCLKHQVDSIAGLPEEVLTDLHEAVAMLVAESPPITFPGDPRRTV